MSGSYWPRGVDEGVADPDDEFRALISSKLSHQAEPTSRIKSLYDPASSQFRDHLTFTEFMERYAPYQSTIEDVKSWLTSRGFRIERTARNRPLLEYTGTFPQFNAAFGTRLHVIKRSSSTWRASVFAPVSSFDVPQALIGKSKRLILPDRAAATGTLSRDTAPIVTTNGDSTINPPLSSKQIPAAARPC